MDPKVSIVIPTISGRIELLQKALSSIEKQTYKNIEIIVVRDDGSPTQKRNMGIERASGKYVAFLDDDDICHPERIERQVELAEKYPDVGLIICWIEDRRFGEPYIDKYKKVITHEEVLQLMRLSSTSSYFARRDILKKLKGFDESLPTAQEYELAIRISAETHHILCVDQILVTQFKTPDQITKDWNKKIIGIKKIREKHKHLYKKLGFIKYLKMRVKFFGVITLFHIANGIGEKIYSIIIPVKRITGHG